MPANPSGVIPFGEVSRGDRADHPINGRQVIVTSYQFQCCGTITAWSTYVSPNRASHRNGVYSITFQVWRPSTPGIDDGCYMMVGEDFYENVILVEETGGLVNRTVPQPSNLIVQPGDVVGFIVSAPNEDENDGIQFNEDDFREEQAWYNEQELMVNTNTCPFPTGPRGVLSGSIRAAPVLSLDIGTYSIIYLDKT